MFETIFYDPTPRPFRPQVMKSVSLDAWLVQVRPTRGYVAGTWRAAYDLAALWAWAYQQQAAR